MTDHPLRDWWLERARSDRLHRDLDDEALFKILLGLATAAEREAALAESGVRELLVSLRPSDADVAEAERVFARVERRRPPPRLFDGSFLVCLTVNEILPRMAVLGSDANARSAIVESLYLWYDEQRSEAKEVAGQVLDAYRKTFQERYAAGQSGHPAFALHQAVANVGDRLARLVTLARSELAAPNVQPALAVGAHRHGGHWLMFFASPQGGIPAIDSFLKNALHTAAQRESWAKTHSARLYFLDDRDLAHHIESYPS